MRRKLAIWSAAFLLHAQMMPAFAQVKPSDTQIVPPTKSAGSSVEKLYALGPRVLGEEWKPLTKTRDSAIFIYTEGSLSDDDTITITIGMEFVLPQGPARYLSSRDLYHIDCKDRSLALYEILKFKEHFGDGDLIDSYIDDGFVMEQTKPDTIGSVLINRVCDHGQQVKAQPVGKDRTGMS